MAARPPGAPASGGLLDSLRAMGGTLHDIVRVRGALFAVELREEVQRRKEMLLLAVVGVVFLHTAILALTFLVAVVFWDTHRIAAIGAMAALYLVCGAVAVIALRVKIASSPAAFAASLRELDQDLARPGTPR